MGVKNMDGTQLGKLDLPSGGGWVEFVDVDDLTGADLHAIRREVRAEDTAGQTGNALFTKAAAVLIDKWQVDYLTDPRTPEANPAWYKKLKMRDLLAIEDHITPVVRMIREGVPPAAIDDTAPGSPTPPDSE